jgi:ribonuclease HII
VAGVDEAGRGPLAGPVVAAAVFIERSCLEAEEHGLLNGLTDSKVLSQSRREFFHDVLLNCKGVEIGVGMADADEIDRVNILRATHLAMGRALSNLPSLPDHALVDGLPVRGLPCPSTAIVRGDSKSLLIAAASVVAKVVRDQQMREFDPVYPQYGFAGHKGYGSRAHVQALFQYGPCPIHRRTFRPVREAEQIRRLAQEETAARR